MNWRRFLNKIRRHDAVDVSSLDPAQSPEGGEQERREEPRDFINHTVRLEEMLFDYLTQARKSRQRLMTSLLEFHRKLPSVNGTSRDEGRVRLILDSLFLYRSYRLLLEDGGSNESFHFATGFEVGKRTFAVCHIVPVAFVSQTVGGVQVDPGSNVATFKALADIGSPVLLHLHTHPGCGPNCTQPSRVDYQYQEKLLRGGFHIAPGCIFSRDGFCRFWSQPDHKFSVEIRGKGIEEVEENVFRIRMADQSVPFDRSAEGVSFHR